MCTMTNCLVSSDGRLTEENPMGLLPGFRFHPTDEEIIVHYLMPKVMNNEFSAVAIGQVDFNKCEPWDLPKVANTGDTVEQYYYCLRDRKYSTGLRTNRATKAGYWKATGKDREIFMGNTDPKLLVGMKKTLVFYKVKAPRVEKTNWVMHEFRLHSQFDKMPKDNYGWVVSRVFHKNADGNGMPKKTLSINNSPFSPNQGSDDSFSIEYTSFPPLTDSSPSSTLLPHPFPSNHQLQDVKPTTYDAYEEDQLLYTADPSYYYPNLSETLVQAHGTYGSEQHKDDDNINIDDGSVVESFNFKVEQYFASYNAGNGFSSYKADIGLNAMVNNYNNDDVEISYSNYQSDEFHGLLPSTLGSVQDQSKICGMFNST